MDTPTEDITPVFAVKYASFFRRLVAALIDGMILGIIGSVISTTLGRNPIDTTSTDSLATINNLLTLLITIAYYVGFWVKEDGQTLGKKAMHIKIIRVDNQPITVFTGLVRYFSSWISGFVLLLGYLWVAFDSKKQTWHDKIAKTYVVESDDQKPRKLIYLIGCFLPILVIVGIIAAIILGMAVGFQSIKGGKSNEFIKELESSNFVEKMTQDEADSLAYDVFTQIANHRQETNLTPLENDGRLCAYSQRRLEQIQNHGRYDDAKGLYEDTAQSLIWTTYFPELQNVNETVYDLNSFSTAKTIVDAWKKSPNSLINKPDYAYACVRATPQFLYLIVGAPKTPSSIQL